MVNKLKSDAQKVTDFNDTTCVFSFLGSCNPVKLSNVAVRGIHLFYTSHWLLSMLRQRVATPKIRKASPASRYRRGRFSAHRVSIPQSIPTTAPKPEYNIRHIRKHPKLYSKHCDTRNYKVQSDNPFEIVRLFEEWARSKSDTRDLRVRNNVIQKELKIRSQNVTGSEKAKLLEEARGLKSKLATSTIQEQQLLRKIDALAAELPNLTSEETPLGTDPEVISYINELPDVSETETDPARSHVEIGADLDLLDFAGAATASGWGWYYLRNEGALLEQALIQYALKVAMEHDFTIVTPPSMVYSHIVSACGFRPRDQSGEQQVYHIAQAKKDQGSDRPAWSLAGTAEIPFAGMKAKQVLDAADLPIKVVGPSRCYRAEAGARGVDTKGLYRVHEFTKVEMFAWTLPGAEQAAFESLLSIQKTILQNLNLPCRILEMPSDDLGASATRKQDIEAFFPSRRRRQSNYHAHKKDNEGWGEVTSASICTDYQTRRLATRVKNIPGSKEGGALGFPSTVNGTAVAVPRVLAAILENGWDDKEGVVRIPEVLWPWMHGLRIIERKRKGDGSACYDY